MGFHWALLLHWKYPPWRKAQARSLRAWVCELWLRGGWPIGFLFNPAVVYLVVTLEQNHISDLQLMSESQILSASLTETHTHMDTHRHLFSSETMLTVAIRGSKKKCKADAAANGRFTATKAAPHLQTHIYNLRASNYFHRIRINTPFFTCVYVQMCTCLCVCVCVCGQTAAGLTEALCC